MKLHIRHNLKRLAEKANDAHKESTGSDIHSGPVAILKIACALPEEAHVTEAQMKYIAETVTQILLKPGMKEVPETEQLMNTIMQFLIFNTQIEVKNLLIRQNELETQKLLRRP